MTWTQAQLAKKIGCTQKNVSKMKDAGKLKGALDMDGKIIAEKIISVLNRQKLLDENVKLIKENGGNKAPKYQTGEIVDSGTTGISYEEWQGSEMEKDRVELEAEKKKAVDAKKEAEAMGLSVPDVNFDLMDLKEAKTFREIFMGRLAELEYKKRSAELVEVSDVEAESFANGRSLRDAFLSLPDRVSAMLVGMDKDEIHKTLREEINIILEKLSE